ncbi:four helix bundle protein [Anseongella ginsenosidimutans]|uniref:Four helix bundle protein n=1 Tax=Anseongella ginsenosidimutans TaxID=496056 RepID=A0A4V2UTN0_9SPHI|nr:four helix bundle protein [Anseongella ginsenosidimutans]QEC52284.1 four helix bundle protein [Anseongella ginsenosidimutans]TCS86842.1 four helix bundle protein [Anseongella ginsenosidimutans]
MATVRRFEDFEVWQKARELSKLVYEISEQGKFASDFSLKDQIRRSSGSIMDNIAEGAERSGNGEFMQFLGIAKGSAGEVRSQLYRALDLHYITREEFDELVGKVLGISKMIMSLIQYLKRSNLKGERFKTQNPETLSTNLKP